MSHFERGGQRRHRPGGPDRRRPEDEDDPVRARLEQMDLEEGHGESLGEMLLKAGRRAVAHHVGSLSKLKRTAEEIRRQQLVHALGEERARFVEERSARARDRANEHLSRALALTLDRWSLMLDAQRGTIDFIASRFKEKLEETNRIRKFVDRVSGADPEDTSAATLKAALVFEMVRDLLQSGDLGDHKLSPEDRKELLDYALGLRKEMPEILTVLLRPPGPRRKEAARADAPAEYEEPLWRLDLTVKLNANGDDPATTLTVVSPRGEPNVPLVFRNDGFDLVRGVTLYVGQCIYLGSDKLLANRERTIFADTPFPIDVTLDPHLQDQDAKWQSLDARPDDQGHGCAGFSEDEAKRCRTPHAMLDVPPLAEILTTIHVKWDEMLARHAWAALQSEKIAEHQKALAADSTDAEKPAPKSRYPDPTGPEEVTKTAARVLSRLATQNAIMKIEADLASFWEERFTLKELYTLFAQSEEARRTLHYMFRIAAYPLRQNPAFRLTVTLEKAN